MNPSAESSPGLQAAVASVQIALSASEMKQIVERATRFIAARLTTKAEIDAIEKAAFEAIEQLGKEGKAVSRDAVEEGAQEAARKAERALQASGGEKAAGSAASNGVTTVRIPGPRNPPPLGASGTPIRTQRSLTDQAAELVPKNGGKSRVTLDSPSQRMEVDLAGKAHGGVPTPHTKVSPRNLQAPAQPTYNTKSSPVREATQQDLRTVRKALERQGD